MNLAVISGLAKSVMGGLDALFTSDEERLTAQAKIMEILQAPHNMQAMITLKEAESPNIFKSGWRPFIGWICATGLFLHFLAFPITEAFMPLFERPEIDASAMLTLVLSLLGLGGMRTYEKFKGITG